MAKATTKKAASKTSPKATTARTVKAVKAATKASKTAKPETKTKTVKTRLKKAAAINQSEDKGLVRLEQHNSLPVSGALPARMEAIVTAIPANKIKSIMVRFTRVIRDVRRRVCPLGVATATYGDDTVIEVDISGGSRVPTYGITDAVTNKPMHRIEGRFYKNYKNQPMPYACFYNRGEALHIGRLDIISHGCVHVADWDKMKRIHDDSVRNKTLVTVRYGPGILDKVWNQTM